MFYRGYSGKKKSWSKLCICPSEKEKSLNGIHTASNEIECMKKDYASVELPTSSVVKTVQNRPL